MINNLYLRLFVAETKLMTAEKMRLDRFCGQGEYLAYNIGLPSEPDLGPNEVAFTFAVDLGNKSYRFSNDYIDEIEFSVFEGHLSRFLNELFDRKKAFEKQNEEFRMLMTKLVGELSQEEQHCLAQNIDVNAPNVLRALGVVMEDDKK